MNIKIIGIVLIGFGLFLNPGVSSADSNIRIYVNEELIEAGGVAQIQEGRILIETDSFFEIIPEIKKIERTNNKIALEMNEKSNHRKYLLTPEYVFKGNGEELNLSGIDVSYVEKDNRLLLPLRSICEAIGYTVLWNQDNYSVKLISKSDKFIYGNEIEGNVIGNVLNYSDIELNVFMKINQLRNQSGLKMLILDERLSNLAKIKAKEMHDKGYYSHYSPKYGDPAIMAEKMGVEYKKIGENIAAEHSSVDDVLRAWVESKTHKENILESNYTHTGVGYFYGDENYNHYYVQMFKYN